MCRGKGNPNFKKMRRKKGNFSVAAAVFPRNARIAGLVYEPGDGGLRLGVDVVKEEYAAAPEEHQA